MKRFQFCVSVFLAVCLVGTILIAKIPGVRAETAQNGVMLTFNSSLGNTTSGNFWLDATGKQMLFTENENGDKRMSLTFTNHGENAVNATLKVVSSDFQHTRGSVTVTVPAGQSANAELMNLNVSESDVYYFYLSGLTQTTKISFKANYAAVDYTALTAFSMQGPGASAFTAEVLYAQVCELVLEKTEHVQYTVSLNNSIFSIYRNQNGGTFSVAQGDTVQVVASPETGYSVDSFISGEKMVTRLSRYTFTAEADITVKAVAVKTEETIANGTYLEFHSNLSASEGDFWLNDTGLAMFYGDEGEKKAAITFINYDTEAITAMFRVVSSSFTEVRFVQSVTVPAGGIATIEAEQVALAAGDVVYLHLSDLTSTSKVGFFASGTEMDYSALTASSMQGTGADTFTVKADAAKAVTVSGAAVEGAAYHVTFHGVKNPQINNVSSFEEVVPAGTLVQVEAVGTNVEGLETDSGKEDKVYQFVARNDIQLRAWISDIVKVQNGVTLTFHDNLTQTSGNFWLSQAQNLTFTAEGDSRLSATLYNEGDGSVSAVLRVVNSRWETIAQNEKVTIPAGESRTIEFMNMAVNETGDIYYIYLEGLTKTSKIRLVFNHIDLDYSVFTPAGMEGTGADTFTASTERVTAALLTLEKNQGIAYTVSVNDSVFASYTKVESLDSVAFIPGTKIEIIAYAPEGMEIGGWEKNGIAAAGEKTLRFIAEDAVVYKAVAKESAAQPSEDGDMTLFMPAIIGLLSGSVLLLTTKKRKQRQ